VHTNPHIALLQMHYQQDEIHSSVEQRRTEAPNQRRRHWTGRYASKRKLTLPAKNADALSGSIPARL